MADRTRIVRHAVYKRDSLGRIQFKREPWQAAAEPELEWAYFPQRRFLWWWRSLGSPRSFGYVAFESERQAQMFLDGVDLDTILNETPEAAT